MLQHHVVLVLVQERVGGVGHPPRVVLQREQGVAAGFGAAVALIGHVRLGQLLADGGGTAAGGEAGLVQEGQHAGRLLGLNQVQHIRVVHKLDVAPVDGLRLVLRLLRLEHVLVEVLLQLLVRQVDAELLERVQLERLKAVDVQDADEASAAGVLPDAGVDLLHQPVKQAGVQSLGQRVPGLGRLAGGQVLQDVPVPGFQRPRPQRLVQCPGLHHQQRRRRVQSLRRGGVSQAGGAVGGGRVCGKSYVPHMQNGGHRLQRVRLLLLAHAHDAHRPPGGLVLGRVGHAGKVEAPALVEVPKLGSRLQQPGSPLLRRGAVAQLVEDVVVPLRVGAAHHPAALQQVSPDGRPTDAAVPIKLDLRVLAEPTAVVVAHRLGVAERLQQRVALQHRLLHRARVVPTAASAGRPPMRLRSLGGQVAHDQLRGLRLAGAGFAGHQDALVGDGGVAVGACATEPQGSVGSLSDGEHVGGQLSQGHPRVLGHHVLPVQVGQALEGVDGDEDGAGVGVDFVHAVPVLQVVQHPRLVQVRQLHHVLHPRRAGGGQARTWR